MSGRNQLLTSPNNLPQSPTKRGTESCRVHVATAGGAAPPGFHFHSQRVDWRTLHGVNVDALVEETNFEDLARCLEAGLLNGNLSAEPPATLTLNNLLQFAQLSQLGLQWLCSLREQDEDKERKLQALTRHAHKYREDFKALAEDHKRVKAREASTQATLAEARAEQQRLQQQLEQVQQQLGQVQHKLAQQSPGEEEVLPPTQPVQPSGPSVEPNMFNTGFVANKLDQLEQSLLRWQQKEVERRNQRVRIEGQGAGHDATLKANDEALAEVKAHIAEREQAIKDLNAQLEQYRIEKQRWKWTEDQKEVSQEEIKRLNKRIVHLEVRCRGHQEELDRLAKQHRACIQEGHQAKIADLERTVKEQAVEIQGFLEQTSVNAALRRQVQKLQAEREELQQDRETALQSKETWKHKAQRHEAGLAEAHAELSRLQAELRSLNSEVDALRRRPNVDELLQQLEAKNKELTRLDGKLLEYERTMQELSDVQDKMEHARKDFRSFEGYLDKLHHAHKDVDAAAYRLKAISRPPSGHDHRQGYAPLARRGSIASS